MSEWPMVQSWKDCVGAIPPGVRIPLSPDLTKWKYILCLIFGKRKKMILLNI